MQRKRYRVPQLVVDLQVRCKVCEATLQVRKYPTLIRTVERGGFQDIDVVEPESLWNADLVVLAERTQNLHGVGYVPGMRRAFHICGVEKYTILRSLFL